MFFQIVFLHKTHNSCEPPSNQSPRSRLFFCSFYRKKQHFKTLILRVSNCCLEGGDPPHSPPLSFQNQCLLSSNSPFGGWGGFPPAPFNVSCDQCSVTNVCCLYVPFGHGFCSKIIIFLKKLMEIGFF